MIGADVFKAATTSRRMGGSARARRAWTGWPPSPCASTRRSSPRSARCPAATRSVPGGPPSRTSRGRRRGAPAGGAGAPRGGDLPGGRHTAPLRTGGGCGRHLGPAGVSRGGWAAATDEGHARRRHPAAAWRRGGRPRGAPSRPNGGGNQRSSRVVRGGRGRMHADRGLGMGATGAAVPRRRRAGLRCADAAGPRLGRPSLDVGPPAASVRGLGRRADGASSSAPGG